MAMLRIFLLFSLIFSAGRSSAGLPSARFKTSIDVMKQEIIKRAKNKDNDKAKLLKAATHLRVLLSIYNSINPELRDWQENLAKLEQAIQSKNVQDYNHIIQLFKLDKRQSYQTLMAMLERFSFGESIKEERQFLYGELIWSLQEIIDAMSQDNFTNSDLWPKTTSAMVLRSLNLLNHFSGDYVVDQSAHKMECSPQNLNTQLGNSSYFLQHVSKSSQDATRCALPTCHIVALLGNLERIHQLQSRSKLNNKEDKEVLHLLKELVSDHGPLHEIQNALLACY